MYVTYAPYLITGYLGTIVLIYCYYMSNKLHHEPIWLKYHMAFHLIMAYNQMLIINSIVCYEKSLRNNIIIKKYCEYEYI